MVAGLAFTTFSTATLMASTYAWAIFALSCNGLEIGLATPTTNLLVRSYARRLPRVVTESARFHLQRGRDDLSVPGHSVPEQTAYSSFSTSVCWHSGRI